MHPHVFYLPAAYDPQVHRPRAGESDEEVPAHDVVLVGSLFGERAELLAGVDWSGIDLALYGDWRGLPRRHKLRRYVRGGIVSNRHAAALYRHAKVGLNLYRESMGWGWYAERTTHAESLNPRAFELAACGCFQVSQPRAEVAEFFGDSVATFRTPDELGQVVRSALADGEMRVARAQQAMRAIQGQTFVARAARLLADAGAIGWPPPRREHLRWLDTMAVAVDSTQPLPGLAPPFR
jgi:spore maturation protein CgeB